MDCNYAVLICSSYLSVNDMKGWLKEVFVYMKKSN